MENIKFIPGDLVKYRGIIFQVDKISLRNSVVTLTKEDKQNYCKIFDVAETKLPEIQDIPLTLEILEKNGWKKVDEYLGDDMYVKRVSGNTNVCFIYLSKLSNRKWSVCLSAAKLTNCMYVHQLQHVLFGLGLNHKMEV